MQSCEATTVFSGRLELLLVTALSETPTALGCPNMLSLISADQLWVADWMRKLG